MLQVKRAVSSGLYRALVASVHTLWSATAETKKQLLNRCAVLPLTELIVIIQSLDSFPVDDEQDLKQVKTKPHVGLFRYCDQY